MVIHLNKSGVPIISIDMPSGLFADKSSKGLPCITATHTLSLQAYKAAFLFAENSLFIGNLHVLPIGLSEHFEQTEPAAFEMLDRSIIGSIYRHRPPFSHKGHFGHAALLVGSLGMMGAAVLAAKACLQAGTGKLTAFIPSCGYSILQSTVPEAMCRITGENHLSNPDIHDAFTAIGIGPGIGTDAETWAVLKKVCSQKKPLLIDADGLNLLAMEKNRLGQIPAGSVITPHPKEFERLFGKTPDDAEQLKLAIQKAAALNIYIVLKGHHTAIITPLGKVYFNDTGNAGMAKGGMGDVLTGLITGLMAQHYSLPEAAMLGVYLHGLAGDIAAEKYSPEAMQASDLLQCIGDAWKTISHS
jgi:NAD(P)H-hydrate epimerase